ncbi:YdhR family protein [Streptomyces sp. ODS05-4]|uniref:YdhR family protein n=1 Tax=Streptomyces sp. ODS05-4 TaxID=2944939 RepID=UPI00210E0B80|nr:YdhR family protein [Streptomyces sp. ODS05-4]
MHAVIVWWDLQGSAQTVESLRPFLRDEAVDRFARVPGLRLKLWLSDSERQRWGALLLWESAEAAAVELAPRAAEVIGHPPAEVTAFDVEATVEGMFSAATGLLAGHGLALEDGAVTGPANAPVRPGRDG